MKTSVHAASEARQKLGSLWLFLLIGVGLGIAVVVTDGLTIVLLMLVPLPMIVILRFPPAIFLFWLAVATLLPPVATSPEFYWVFYRLFLPCLFLLTLTFIRAEGRSLPGLGVADWSMVAYLLVVTTSIAWRSEDPAGSLAKLFDRAFVPFVAYGLARLVGLRENWVRFIIPFLAGLVAIEALIGLWSYFVPASLPESWVRDNLYGRASGTLRNPNAYSSVLVFYMVFLLNYIFSERTRPMRSLRWILVGVGMSTIFLTYSRASWLALIVFSLALLLLRFRAFAPFALLVSLVGVVLLSTVYTEGLNWAAERLGNQKNVERRLIQMQASALMFQARPILGWGYEDYDKYDRQFVQPVGEMTPIEYDFIKGTSHNTFLTILAETGLMGLLCYIFPFFWWLRKSLVVLPGMSSGGYFGRDFMLLLWLAIVFYFIVTQFMDMQYIPFATLLVWLGLGITANLAENHLRDRKSQQQQELSGG